LASGAFSCPSQVSTANDAVVLIPVVAQQVMIERCSGTVIGDIGFHGPPDDTGTIEVGYSVIPSRRRRGYATEAAKALVGWARSQPSVHVIVAGCDPNNVSSVRTLERVGFRRTGEANGETRWRYGGTSGRPG